MNHGCVFYKLFLRAFPRHFRADSVYAHYPMVIPPENAKILKDLKRDHLFSWDRPVRGPEKVCVRSCGAAKTVLGDTTAYRPSCGEGQASVLGETGRMKTSDREKMDGILYPEGWKKEVKTFYATVSERLLAQKSYKLAGRTQVDLVRDVGNLSHAHFAARLFSLPLKTSENPRGVISEEELYTSLSCVYAATHFDLDPAESFPKIQVAREAAEKLGGIIEGNVKLGKLGLGFARRGGKHDALAGLGDVVKKLGRMGKSGEVARGMILPAAAEMVPTQAEMVSLYTPSLPLSPPFLSPPFLYLPFPPPPSFSPSHFSVKSSS